LDFLGLASLPDRQFRLAFVNPKILRLFKLVRMLKNDPLDQEQFSIFDCLKRRRRIRDLGYPRTSSGGHLALPHCLSQFG